MPLTALGFTVCALAISGVWPLNGFVSKEMVFHGAIETGYWIFAVAAWVGAIFTFASFLKAGHSVFFGERSREIPTVRESPSPIVIPILVLAGLCILFGVYNKLPLTQFIQPILAQCPDPQAAFHSWMDRDAAFGEVVWKQAEERGMQAIRVDGREGVEEIMGRVERMFGW